jgi:hypothetical protein
VYERADEFGSKKVFLFFTIKDKKASASIDDSVARKQNLNNASQSLHQMYEFFKDAGPQHEEEFFAKVRFFSVVSSTKGFAIRIHRATREPEDGSERGFIMPDRTDYPLRFEFQELVQLDNFHRQSTFEIFEKILIGYGANELFSLIQNAVIAISEKVSNDREAMIARTNLDFYRYSQPILKSGSRKSTPASSRAASSRAPSVMSLDSRKRSATPVNKAQKRSRGRSWGGQQRSPLAQEAGDNRRMSYQPVAFFDPFSNGINPQRAHHLNTSDTLFRSQQQATVQHGSNMGSINQQMIYGGSYSGTNNFRGYSQAEMSGNNASMPPPQAIPADDDADEASLEVSSQGEYPWVITMNGVPQYGLASEIITPEALERLTSSLSKSASAEPW